LPSAVRQDAVVLSQLLLRLVTATMVTALALFLVQPANAQSPKVAFAIPYSGTLKKINNSGEIRIGYRENSPSFAFLDARRNPLGYSLDLCKIVVEEIAAELGKDLKVIRRPVTPENRFDLVTSGEVDLKKPSPSGVRLHLPMNPHLEELFHVQGLPSD
jgi:ABC-type amino acid transport substrate-binding protein